MSRPDVLVGRAGELAVVDRAVADAAHGRGSIVLITGPAGIGKSAVLAAAVDAAAAGGAEVGRAHAVDDPGAPALWPWTRLVRSWPGADALPVAERGEPDAAARFRLFVAHTDLLRDRAGAGVLVVALEDLHWADVASVQLLRHLSAEIATLPVVVVATVRDGVPGPLDDARPDLVTAHAVVPVRLPALSVEDVARWLPALLGREDGVLATQLHGCSGGNPLFVRLVAEDLAATPDGPVASQRPETFADGPQLRRVVAARVAGLGPDAREAVEAAAVVGVRMPVAVLAAMLGRPVAGLPAALAPVLEHERTGVVRFEHALVRDAVYAALAPEQRARLHRRAAEVLADLLPADAAGSIAHHWRKAGGPDAAARSIEWARRADDQARAVLAFDDAAGFAGLAVDAARDAGAGPAEIAGALVRHAEALYLANYLTASVGRCVEAADLAEAAGRADLVAAAALVVHGMGDPAANRTVPALCERALVMLAPGEHVARARLLAQIAVGAAETEGGSRAAALAAEALAEARRSGDDEALLEAIAARHLAISVPQTVQERLDLGRRAVELGRSMSRPIAGLWGHLWRVDAAMQLGNLAEADREIAEIDRVATQRGSALARWHHHRCLARRRVLIGDFEAAGEANDAARAIGRRIGDVSIEGMYYAFRVQLSWLRGVVDVGPGWTQLMAAAPPMPLVRIAVPMMHAVGGETELARAEFEQFRSVVREYPLGTRWLGTVAQVATVAVLLGDAAVCADAYDLLAPLAHYYSGDGSGAPFSHGSNGTIVADLARVAGRPDVAVAHYDDAIAMNVRIGARPFTALARLGRAQALVARGRPGDPDDAAGSAAAAAAEFRRLDMPGRLAVADKLLAAIERDRRCASPLSAREAEVAALVAQALSNREVAARLVLSERTVESHVRSILAKLGLHSRTEIVAWALRR